MKPYLLECYGNPSQTYSFSKKAKRALKQARSDIADCIGAKPEQIFFTSGGTESDNWVIKQFGSEYDMRRVITSCIEHHAVLNSCSPEETKLVSVDSEGSITPQSLQAALKMKDVVSSCHTTLVSIMLANNEIGTIEPIKELVQTAKAHGAIFHTDAVQAIGHIPVNVTDLGVDFMSASAHKFNGPKGIGFLYYRGGDILRPYENGGSQECGMRAGTENVASVVAMAEALKWNTENMYRNTTHLNLLTEVFLNKLNNIDYILNGHPTNRLPGNINISIRGKIGEGLMHLLDLRGIAVSTGAACDGKNTATSHVIQAIGVHEDYANGTLRISFSHENTEEDARIIAKILCELIAK